MANLVSKLVTPAAGIIWGGTGASGDTVAVINLDNTNTAYIGNDSSVQTGAPSVPLGPGDSIPLDAAQTIYAIASQKLQVAVIPGGGSFAPGTVDISGPVTATISGPVTVDGTVGVSSITAPVTVGSITAPVTVSSVTAPIDIGTVSGSIDINSVSGNVNVVGQGGYVLPGQNILVVNDSSNHTIGANSTISFGPYDVATYQSFSLTLDTFCTSQASAGAPLTAQVQIAWTQTSVSYYLETETYWMWTPNTSLISPFTIGGPAKAAQFTLSIHNPSPTTAMTLDLIQLFGCARPQASTKANQPAPGSGSITGGLMYMPSSNPGLFNPASGWDGVLAAESNNAGLSPSNTYWLPLPFYAGQVTARFQTAIALAHDFVLASAYSLVNGVLATGTNTQGVLWNPGNTAGAEYTANLVVANAPMYLVVSTSATLGPVISVSVQGTPSG